MRHYSRIMKYTKILIVAATFTFVAAMVAMLFVGGVNAQQTAPNAEDRKEIQQGREEARDLKNEDRKATRITRAKLRGQNIIERATIRIDKLEKLNIKATDLTQKMQEKEIDITLAVASLQAATEKIALARASVSEAKTMLDQLENAEDPLAVAKNFKSKMTEVYKTLVDARQSMKEGIQLLKSAKTTTN